MSKNQDPSPRSSDPNGKTGKNEIYHRENLVGPFLVHKLLGPKSFLPPPPRPPGQRTPCPAAMQRAQSHSVRAPGHGCAARPMPFCSPQDRQYGKGVLRQVQREHGEQDGHGPQPVAALAVRERTARPRLPQREVRLHLRRRGLRDRPGGLQCDEGVRHCPTCVTHGVWKRLAFNIYITHPGRVVYLTQGCIRREGTSEAAPAAVRQAVGGGCQSGGGRLLSVTKAGGCHWASGRQ